MKCVRIAGILCLIALSTLFWIVPMAKAQEIEEKVILLLPESIQITGNEIILGAIGTITGSPELAQKVAAVNAGTAPRAGSSRRLTKGQIEVRLRQAGLDLSKIEFQGANTVQIFGILQAAAPKDNTSTTSTSLGTSTSSAVPTYEVVVAARDLSRGEILTPSDLTVEERELRNVQPDGRSLNDFIGLRTTRYVLSGAILNHLNVEVVPTIERGASVTILVQTSSLAVTAPGVARASGAIGDVIAVENTLSRQVVYAEILDSETVQIRMRGAGTP